MGLRLAALRRMRFATGDFQVDPIHLRTRSVGGVAIAHFLDETIRAGRRRTQAQPGHRVVMISLRRARACRACACGASHNSLACRLAADDRRQGIVDFVAPASAAPLQASSPHAARKFRAGRHGIESEQFDSSGAAAVTLLGKVHQALA